MPPLLIRLPLCITCTYPALNPLFRSLSAADGVYTGEWSTMAICGFVRGMGEADGAFDRLWTKCYEDAKGSI